MTDPAAGKCFYLQDQQRLLQMNRPVEPVKAVYCTIIQIFCILAKCAAEQITLLMLCSKLPNSSRAISLPNRLPKLATSLAVRLTTINQKIGCALNGASTESPLAAGQQLRDSKHSTHTGICMQLA